jgi:hypothetical protein
MQGTLPQKLKIAELKYVIKLVRAVIINVVELSYVKRMQMEII